MTLPDIIAYIIFPIAITLNTVWFIYNINKLTKGDKQ